MRRCHVTVGHAARVLAALSLLCGAVLAQTKPAAPQGTESRPPAATQDATQNQLGWPAKEQSLELLVTPDRVYTTPMHVTTHVYVFDVKSVIRGTFTAARYVLSHRPGFVGEGKLLPALGCEYDRGVGHYVCKNRGEVSLTVGGGVMRFKPAGGEEVRVAAVTNLSARAIIFGPEEFGLGGSGAGDFKLSDLDLTHLCHRRGEHLGQNSPPAGLDIFSSALRPAEYVAKYVTIFEGASFTPEGEGGTWRFQSGRGEVLTVMPAGADGPHGACELRPPAGARSIVLLSSKQ